MSFYLRKSISAGPVRFNLSKSGIGMSTGVKGFRVGTGPRGSYVRAGRGGVYYRQTLGSAPRSKGVKARELPFVEPNVDDFSAVSLEQDIADLADVSRSDLVRRIQEAAALKKPSWFTGPLSYKQRKADWLAERACPVFYELDTDLHAAYEQLVEAGQRLQRTPGRWYDKTEGTVTGAAVNKGNAGASATVDRVPLSVALSALPSPTFNFDPLTFVAPTRRLVFLPDQVIVLQGKTGVGSLDYAGMQIEVNARRFITPTVPSGVTPVGQTWKYVNTKGGPDKRYKDNPQFAVLAVWELDIFHRHAGFEFHTAFSDESAVNDFSAAVQTLMSVLPTQTA
jgi:hypothetical protein